MYNDEENRVWRRISKPNSHVLLHLGFHQNLNKYFSLLEMQIELYSDRSFVIVDSSPLFLFHFLMSGNVVVIYVGI